MPISASSANMRASILLLAVLAAVAVAVNADCTSPKENGKSCATHRYYYKKGKGKCVKFYYKGRGGNENNFKTKGDCEAACPADRSTCKLEKDSGRKCGGIRYNFDTEKGKCVRFNFKGRDGNDNNYKSKSDCDAACTGAPPPTEPPATAAPEFQYDLSTSCSAMCRTAIQSCPDIDNCVVSCASGSADCGGTVWGSGIYTDDSRLCRAAIHDGVIPASGGTLRVIELPGQNPYDSTTQNGITTNAYGSWGASCSFAAV